MGLEDGTTMELTQHCTPANFARSNSVVISLETILSGNPFGLLKSPKELLTKAWEDNKELGSSTFVVVTLPSDENKIYTSYVGDSGYCILRLNSNSEEVVSLVHESTAQQRRFNFPYQLGWGRNGDHPEVALNFSHEVKNGDLIILGTDGLFDNLAPQNVRGVYKAMQDR